MKAHYDPKTTVPIPCPYKPPGGKVTYRVNPRLFQVVDSKGNIIQPLQKHSSKFALSSAKKPNSKADKVKNTSKGGLKFHTKESDSTGPT